MALRRVSLAPGTIACALVMTALGVEAHAVEPRTASLGWARLPGAEACPGPRELALDVEARLGHASLSTPSVSDLSIEGHVAPGPEPAAFTAMLRMFDRDGTPLGSRTLTTTDPTCRDLGDPLGLAVALMLDPDAEVDRRAGPAAASPGPPSTVDIVAPRLDTPGGAHADGDAPAVKRRFQVDGGVVGAVGLLPIATVGGRLRLLLDGSGFPGVELTGVHFPTVSNGGPFSMTYGGFGLCPFTPDFEVVRFAACAGVSAGAITAESALGAQTDALVLPHVRAGLVRRLVGPMIATLDLGFIVPVNGQTYYYGNTFAPGPAGTLDVGIGVEVP